MRFMQSILLASSVAFGAAMAMTPRLAADDYTFINVADSSGPLGTNFGWPDINDAGTAVFWNGLDVGNDVAIYIGNGGALTPHVSTLRTFSNLWMAPTINSAGVVAFWGETSPGVRGIYTSVNGAVTTIADDPGTVFYDFGTLPSINDSGDVVYTGNLENPCCENAVGLGAGVLYSGSGVFAGFSNATINGAGTVAFNGGLDTTVAGIFTGNGGPTTTIASNASTFASFISPGSINDSGAVAFIATRTDGIQGVFIGSGGPISTITTTQGPFSAFSAHGVAFNNHGALAFFAHLDAGGFGIFTGPDPDADKVVQVGDELFGSVVYSVNTVRGLNNHGDIAFTYVLENESGGAGLAGIAIAKAARSALPGDIDGDGDVDAADLGTLLGAWGTNNPVADLNDDGVVNAADLALLLGGWTG